MAKKNSSGCRIASNEEWMVEDALRTLTRAAEIKKDPKLMAKVKVLAQKKLQEVAAVAAGSVADPN